MRSPSNADVVRRLLLASNSGDADAFVEHLHPDVEWHSVGLFLHPARVWRGHAALRRGLADRVEHHRGHPVITLREVTDEGDRVLVIGAIAVPASRRPAILPIAWIFDLRDGLVWRTRTFGDDDLAREKWG